MRAVLAALVLVAMAASCATAMAQAPDAGDDLRVVLAGKTIPLEVKLKDLDGSWRRFVLGGGEGSAAFAQIYGTEPERLYTVGRTVRVGRQTLVVAYSPNIKQLSMLSVMRRSGGEQTPVELTPETTLSLSLLNLSTIAGMTDIHVFDMQQEIADWNAARELAQSTIAAMASGPEEGPDSNLQHLAVAAQMYLADWEKLPPLDDSESLKEALIEYVADESVFIDRATGEPYEANQSLSGRSASEIDDPAKTVIFYEGNVREDGSRGVAFVDGHVQRVTNPEWEKLKAESGIE